MRKACCVPILLSLLATTTAAETDADHPAILRGIPRTATELRALAEDRADLKCEVIDTGQPVEVTDFSELISQRRASGADRPLAVIVRETCRRSVLSFGMEITPDDQRGLPKTTSGLVLAQINGTYSAIQVRIQRDSPESEPYLSARPIVIQAAYDQRPTTSSYTNAICRSDGRVHGLGLFLKLDATATPQELRTLIALYYPCADDAHPTDVENERIGKPRCELLFVRARITDGAAGQEIRLHAFVTDADRTRLQSMSTFQAPTKAADCDVQGTICFQGYYASLHPAGSKFRRIATHPQANFALTDLDRYAAAQGWKGDALDNLTEILDAIIDGRIR